MALRVAVLRVFFREMLSQRGGRLRPVHGESLSVEKLIPLPVPGALSGRPLSFHAVV